MKKVLIIVIIIVLVGLGVWLYSRGSFDSFTNPTPNEQTATDTPEQQATTTDELETETIIGTSVNGNDIIAYHYGVGGTELLFVGGIHGGYSWNTALVAYEAMDWFEANPDVVPDNMQVTVIPILNPDGLERVVGTTGRFTASDVPSGDRVSGRFNGNNVDLNRNFDCDWQSEGVWQNKTVDGGDAAFSEPESAALRDYVETHNPAAVVVWYSAVGGVFASNCHSGVLDETRTLTNLYADASGYKAYEEFNFYEITGDAVNWLAREGIPGISVLLTTHESTEWSKNRAGIEALLEYYSE